MSGSTKSNHHFVPRFYLRRWEAEEGGGLWAFRREGDRALKPRQYPVGQILYEKDLYTVRGSRQDDVFFGEDEVFEEIDNGAADAIRTIVDDRKLDVGTEKMQALWRFMYTLQVRNPRTIRDLGAEFPQMSQEITVELTKKHGPPIPGRPEMAELIHPEDAGKFLATMIAKQDHRYNEYFNVFSAYVFLKPPVTLLTSDYPFLAFPDFDAPQAMLVFPLAPDCAFLAFAQPQMAPMYLDWPARRLADFVNLLVVAQAEFVYSNTNANEAKIYSLLGSSSRDKAAFRQARDSVRDEGAPLFDYE